MPLAWITGASGFIGGHVTQRFLEAGWSVIGIDRDPVEGGRFPHIATEVGRVSLQTAFDRLGPPQAVFHGAGNGSVGRSIADPAMCRRDTLDSTLRLLDFLIVKAPDCRIVFPSSAAIYGAASQTILSEDCLPNPVSPYGEHKLAAEEACLEAAKAGQPVAILRMFSVYGPGLRKQLPWELGRKLLSGDKATLFGTGDEVRDFFCVTDAARLIFDLATTARPTPLIVNGGTGIGTTVASFAEIFGQALGHITRVKFNGEERNGDPKTYLADTTRLDALGFRATVNLRDGLAEYAQWLKRDIQL
jgi:UDP-glucose 4-epimerase